MASLSATKAEGRKINEELRSFFNSIGRTGVEVQKALLYFYSVEDHCVDANNTKCVEKYDSMRIKIEEVQRRRFKEMYGMRGKCKKYLHHTMRMEEVIPVNSKEQLEKARSYLSCTRPYLEKAAALATEELDTVKRLTTEIKRIANIPD